MTTATAAAATATATATATAASLLGPGAILHKTVATTISPPSPFSFFSSFSSSSSSSSSTLASSFSASTSPSVTTTAATTTILSHVGGSSSGSGVIPSYDSARYREPPSTPLSDNVSEATVVSSDKEENDVGRAKKINTTMYLKQHVQRAFDRSNGCLYQYLYWYEQQKKLVTQLDHVKKKLAEAVTETKQFMTNFKEKQICIEDYFAYDSGTLEGLGGEGSIVISHRLKPLSYKLSQYSQLQIIAKKIQSKYQITIPVSEFQDWFSEACEEKKVAGASTRTYLTSLTRKKTQPKTSFDEHPNVNESGLDDESRDSLSPSLLAKPFRPSSSPRLPLSLSTSVSASAATSASVSASASTSVSSLTKRRKVPTTRVARRQQQQQHQQQGRALLNVDCNSEASTHELNTQLNLLRTQSPIKARSLFASSSSTTPNPVIQTSASFLSSSSSLNSSSSLVSATTTAIATTSDPNSLLLSTNQGLGLSQHHHQQQATLTRQQQQAAQQQQEQPPLSTMTATTTRRP